ncbi:MAG: nucleotidyltransferase domain-containing protein [Actinobacteria bacterium]|nr:nucleotidyltransferase domain-containing protein [Actinomycetota bacterium]
MEIGHPFRVVTPSLDGEILAVLVAADDECTAPTIHKRIGDFSQSGVRKACARLTEQGIILMRRVGNADVFRLNRDHIAAGPIIDLAGLRGVLFDRIADHLDSWEIPSEYSALFGSVTRGTMSPRSDVDVFIVRPEGRDEDDPTWRGQVDDLSRQVTAWTGNSTRILEYRARDMKEGLRLSGNPIAVGEPSASGIRLAGVPVHVRGVG